MDIYDITPGIPYARSIMEGIKSCCAMVVLYSRNANSSDDILNEIDQAHSNKIALFPYLLDETPMSSEMSYYLKRRQWINAYPNYHSGLSPLIKALKEMEDNRGESILRRIALVGSAYSGRSSIMNAIHSVVTGEGPVEDYWYPEPIQYGNAKNAVGNYLGINGRNGRIRLYDINAERPADIVLASDAIVLNMDATNGWTNFESSIISVCSEHKIPILAICINKADMLADETDELEQEIRYHLSQSGLSHNIPIIGMSALGSLNEVPAWTDRIRQILEIIIKF